MPFLTANYFAPLQSSSGLHTELGFKKIYKVISNRAEKSLKQFYTLRAFAGEEIVIIYRIIL